MIVYEKKNCQNELICSLHVLQAKKGVLRSAEVSWNEH